MAILIPFRTSFFVTAFLSALYTRTLLTSSIVLAFAAYLFYPHPSDNSSWQETVVFLWTWAAAVVCALIIAPKRKAENMSAWIVSSMYWPVFYELSLVEGHMRRKLVPGDALSWVCAVIIAIGSYAALELVGYDRGTFYRLQSLVWLLLLLLIVFVFDDVSMRTSAHLMPLEFKHRNMVAVAVVSAALLIDILVRDPGVYQTLLPVVGAVSALAGVRYLLLARRRAHVKRA